MDANQALSRARREFGNAQVSQAGSLCIISLWDEGYYVPMGYGTTWEDALIDCASQYAFAVEGTYA